MKKFLISLILMFVIIFSRNAYAAQPATYDLGNGYTAVRNDVFDKLVENDRLIDLIKEERDYYKKTLEEFMTLEEQKSRIQEERIAVLKDTIEVKNSIIELKDDNLQNWEKLYNMEKAEVRSLKIKKTWEKILTLGLGAYAFSQLEDSTDKAVVGSLTVYLVTN